MTLDDVRSPIAVRSPEWFRTATRWTQLTFVEDDPLHFDVDFWLEVMRESQSNALCLSAGGYIAFYPTKVPFHYRSSTWATATSSVRSSKEPGGWA